MSDDLNATVMLLCNDKIQVSWEDFGGDGCTAFSANSNGSSFKRIAIARGRRRPGPQKAGAGARPAVFAEGVGSPFATACGPDAKQMQAQAAQQRDEDGGSIEPELGTTGAGSIPPPSSTVGPAD